MDSTASLHPPQGPTPTTSTINPNNNNNTNTHNNINPNPNKRSFDQLGLLQTTSYFKIRAILHDLRPLFIQVLQAPDIQNCGASHEIQEKMKVVLDLCKQRTGAENPPLFKCNNGKQDLGGGEHKPGIKPSEHPSQGDRTFTRPGGNNQEKQTNEVNKISGTYIVGGSAFGWNFITFHGTKPEYYGRTKEAFRAANVQNVTC